MDKYRKKPIEIAAIQWVPSDERSAEIRAWAEPDVAVVDTDHIQHLWDYDLEMYVFPGGKTVHAPYQTRCLIVLTFEGEMVVAPNWWIIRGVQGEFYPCDPDIFETTYEAMSPEYEVIAPDAHKAWLAGNLEPGALVRSKNRGKVVFELVEATRPGSYVRGRLRDTRTGRSVGWKYLDWYAVVKPKEN